MVAALAVVSFQQHQGLAPLHLAERKRALELQAEKTRGKGWMGRVCVESRGDWEQEQRRSYSFLCSVERKKETHQETRLWSTGSLTLADKKELM